MEGLFSETEAQILADVVIAEAKKLRPGFGFINDISGSQPLTEAGAKQIQRAQSFLQQQGIRCLVRICDPEHNMARLQLERKGKEAGYRIEQKCARSLAEAEQMLEGQD